MVSPAAQSRRGGSPRAVRTATVAELRQWDHRVEVMKRAGDLRITKVRDDSLLPDRRHERFTQYYKGVRVFGGDLTRQTRDGQTVSVFGKVYEGIDLDPTPSLSIDEATAVVQKMTGVGLGPGHEPELVVFPREDGSYVLTYRARVMAHGTITVYFIDARTGAEVFRYNDLKTQSAVGSGKSYFGTDRKMSTRPAGAVFYTDDQLRPPRLRTFDMHGDLGKVEDFLNGRTSLYQSDMASDTDNVWTDSTVVDGHAYAGWTYDYYYRRFNRHGLDGNDYRILMLVHPVNLADFQSYYDSQNWDVIDYYYLNAFYAGGGVMVIGEGLPSTNPFHLVAHPFDAGLDVVAHELTHGVTDFTSELVYMGESGALNEAYSDIVGNSVEFYWFPAGSGPEHADYVVGRDVIDGGLRSLANPGLFQDPDHYSKRFMATCFCADDDNGGVHTNSLIASHAYYLAIEGGTNRTSGLAVQGVGAANREQIEKVFYRAFTYLMPSTATFADARRITIQAARDLYSTGGAVERAITQAWTAVGVN